MKALVNMLVSDINLYSGGYVVLKLVSDGVELPSVLPGQFVTVALERQGSDFRLRRPFSVCDIDDKGMMTLLIRQVGESTRRIATLKPGERVSVMVPLGENPFPHDNLENKRILLVGGGVGAAPLVFYANRAAEKGLPTTLIVGARTLNELPPVLLLLRFPRLTSLHTITEDGQSVENGLVTQSSLIHKPYDICMTCGPRPMLKAIASLMNQNNIPCFVSLENTMACGVGACLCCVEDTVRGNECVCTRGPVFCSKDLKW